MFSFCSDHKRFFRIAFVLVFSVVSGLLVFSIASPKNQEPGLLFYLSGSQGFTADYAAGGNPEPNFLEKVKIIPNGAQGPGFECDGKQLMSYWAPGNIYAERGTLSFFWRAREPVGKTEFPIFRVGFADHSSWDMVWLRIDYNGHGFDAFVTDVNLARVRVSTTVSPFPKPDKWIHLALSWDETTGIRFYVNGVLVAKKDSIVVLYAGLDQFGPHSRVIGPSQVQSAYNFQRGGDIDEIRIYDRMLSSINIKRLAKGELAGEIPDFSRSLKSQKWQAEWQLRYGWNRSGDIPPYLEQQNTCIRKIEIQDVYDLKRWWWKGTDGIRETTWPGVYNRSRLPGRNDYFQLPDWDCYSLSGKSVTFFMPDETWNHLEISGAAWGSMSLIKSDTSGNEINGNILFQRPKGQEKTFHRLSQPMNGQKIRFTNVKQEMPIGELSAYYVHQEKEPSGICTLNYSLTTDTTGSNTLLEPLFHFINGRYLPDERTITIALPNGAKQKSTIKNTRKALPLVHVLIPCNAIEDSFQVQLDSSYAWEKIHGGLDGIAIDLPAMNLKPTHGKYIPLNIQIKDPNWPMRNMLDFSFSVKPNEARTLWLDTRDRILTKGKSLYFTLAAACPDFGSSVLEGAKVRLIFKSWHEAYREHVQDRFTQVRDNYANLIEERTDDPRLNLFNRFEADIKDLLNVDPKHYPGQNYLYDSDRQQKKPDFIQPSAPKGIPLWAFRQIEDLRSFKRFVLWYIDHRQISNGELGGGLSDDDDMTACWPGAVSMGCEPEKISSSLLRMLDAIYDQGMFTQGLSTIQTDGLHAFEDGIETQTHAMVVDYGSPKQFERIMETVRALDERIMLKNKAGHRHFRSSYFSGTKIADESVWEWALQPHQFLLLQPVLTLAEYNGNPRARQLAIDMADGLLAHARKDANGKLILDTEINFSTDSARVSPLGSKAMFDFSMGYGGVLNSSSAGLQLLWAVYRMTGDKKYLQPLLDLGEGVLGLICGDAVNILSQQNTWGKKIVEKASAAQSTDLYKHIAWQLTGNKTYLEQYYADQIESNALREYINTEGSLWIDRVFIASRELQRSRLGGIASIRGAIQSGHVVSWKFKAPATEESMAILVPFAMPKAIKIIAYTLDSQPVEANMTPWNIEPGIWILAQGLDRNGDDQADTTLSAQFVNLERGKSVTLNFAPHATTILSLGFYSPSISYAQRPDLGIGKEDVRYANDTLTVRVHSLGSLDASASTLTLIQGDSVITSVSVPALLAPIDLMPKFTNVTLSVPKNIDLKKCSIRINPGIDVLEITDLNNRVELSENIKMNNTANQKTSDDQFVTLKKQPRLEHIAFNVKDPATIAQWYCDHAGMEIVRKSSLPDNAHFICDRAGNIAFEFYHNADVPLLDFAAINHLSLHLALMVDDVNAMKLSLLAAGATLVQDVTTTLHGDQVLMLRDPWGLTIQFVKRITPMLQPAGIRPEHVALNVSDPQSMTNWYIENLGMKIMREDTSPNYTSFFMNANRNMMVELFQNASYPMLELNSINHLSLHIAFMVDDVRTIRNALIAAGATVVEDIKTSSDGDEILMLRDPWGVPIQFVKRGKPILK